MQTCRGVGGNVCCKGKLASYAGKTADTAWAGAWCAQLAWSWEGAGVRCGPRAGKEETAGWCAWSHARGPSKKTRQPGMSSRGRAGVEIEAALGRGAQAEKERGQQMGWTTRESKPTRGRSLVRAGREKEAGLRLGVAQTAGKKGKAGPAGLGLAWQLACRCWAGGLGCWLGLLGRWPWLLAWASPSTYLGQDLGQKWALSPIKVVKNMINKIQK